jgi:hypothetical protein
MTKSLAIIAAGLFALFMGFKSLSGYEAETEHLYSGDFVTLTCDSDGQPVSGAGWLSTSADQACSKEQSDQQGRARWWLLGGAFIVIYGYVGFRRVRSGSSG